MIHKLAFERQGQVYEVTIEADLNHVKASRINTILEEEGVTAKLGAGYSGRQIRMGANGLIRPVAMRLIINELAR